ncbi:ribosomal-protein-alanine acetyltransferase [Natronococcus amylolyticus DSM 10524]|uniref:Ribosomal-protein-alanine acetyltransferase n=1 Tax=Natronococcus amylolyticus DSM 10524 TaxID=1227497 RepID=L9XGR7_9EURY|nr:ribosomal protein S18-alanine N-acetyltransferase [Natronococcus amylolyticus]ELY60924.1 ribosomal-protein-alanine acetyltransferase [Natronococcus amylolyticus DSM 10524]
MTTSAPAPEEEYSIRPAERADLLAVVRIERESFPQPWPYDAFERFLDEPGFLVAVDALGAVAGYVVADVNRQYGRNRGHVKDIAVRPERRGSGVGSALLSRIVAVLLSHGADSIKLEVRESNDAAKRLYRKFRFEPLRRVPGYYDDEDAIVMVRKLE